MNIVHFSDAKFWGGNEQQLLLLLKSNYLNERINQKLICLNGSPLHKKAEKLDIETYTIDSSSKYSLRQANKYMQLLQKAKADIVHIHNSGALTRHYLSYHYKNNDFKVVFSKKGLSSSSTMFSRLKYNMKTIRKIICVSEYVRKGLLETLFHRNHHKLEVIYDGIDLNYIPNPEIMSLTEHFPESKGKIIIGNIANHSVAKDLPTFIQFAKELKEKDTENRFFFIQIGEETKETPQLIRIVKNEDLSSCFRFFGFSKDARSYLYQMDYFVMSSIREGLPFVIMEAMNARCPVVSTAAGGIPELVFHHKTGMLSKIEDSKDLANHLYYLFEHPEEKLKMTQAAYNYMQQKHSEQLNMEHTLQLYIEVYTHD